MLLSNKEEHNDILIIGGGVSGLACAHKIRSKFPFRSVKILEAKGRIGGRVFGKSVKTVNGNEKFDFGGQWVGRSQLHVMRIINEVGLELYKQSYVGKTVNILDKNEVTYTSSPTDLLLTSFWTMYDLVKGFKKIDELCQLLSIEDPLSYKQAREWDSMTLDTAVKWIFSKQACRKLMDVAVLTMFGFESSQASFLYFLLYVKCSGGTAVLVDETFSGNAQEFKIKGGTFQVVDLLAEKIGCDNIILNSPVIRIQQDESGCKVKTSDGMVYTSQYAVLAIPPHLRTNIIFEPPLPSTHQRHLEFLHTGHLIKCIITYSECFWNRKGLSGMTVHWPYYEHGSECPISLTYDATLSTGSPAIVGFIGGHCAIQKSQLEGETLKKEIVRSLVMMFGEEASQPLDVCFQDWTKEEYNGGCPVTFTTPGAISLYGEDCLRNPHQRIHFAGTETATIWRGFIDGAIQSGERAANEILLRMDSDYIPTDEIAYEDILLPGLLTVHRNSYYALNAFLMTTTVTSLLVLAFCIKRHYS